MTSAILIAAILFRVIALEPLKTWPGSLHKKRASIQRHASVNAAKRSPASNTSFLRDDGF
jgi:hypothetical protein